MFTSRNNVNAALMGLTVRRVTIQLFHEHVFDDTMVYLLVIDCYVVLFMTLAMKYGYIVHMSTW